MESAAGVVRGNGSKNTSFIRRVIRPWATREMEENIWPQKSEAENKTHLTAVKCVRLCAGVTCLESIDQNRSASVRAVNEKIEQTVVRDLLTADMARLKGFEPPASSLGGTHSIQLSYKR